MSTKYIKVKVSERLPKFGQRIIALVTEQNDLGLSKYLWNVSYNDEDGSFSMEDGRSFNVEYWLEEVTDNEADLRKENKEIKAMLERCKNFLPYVGEIRQEVEQLLDEYQW